MSSSRGGQSGPASHIHIKELLIILFPSAIAYHVRDRVITHLRFGSPQARGALDFCLLLRFPHIYLIHQLYLVASNVGIDMGRSCMDPLLLCACLIVIIVPENG